MRDFNKVNPSLWGSQKFKKLSQSDKLIYLYFLTSPHSNSCGCYWCPLGYMMADLKISEEELRKGIERVCHTLLICFNFDEEIVFLDKWFRFNPPSNPNHAKKVFEDIKGLSLCEEKTKCLQEFKECLSEKSWEIPEELETLLKGYRKGIESLSPLDQTRLDKTETKIETETEGPKDKKLSEGEKVYSLIKSFDQAIINAYGKEFERLAPTSKDKMTAKDWLDRGITTEFCEEWLTEQMSIMKAKEKICPSCLSFFSSSICQAFASWKGTSDGYEKLTEEERREKFYKENGRWLEIWGEIPEHLKEAV